MRPYTLDEVKALPTGSNMYIEFMPVCLWDDTPATVVSAGMIKDADGVEYRPSEEYVGYSYGYFYRCWPSQPSEDDKAAAKWGDKEEQHG